MRLCKDLHKIAAFLVFCYSLGELFGEICMIIECCMRLCRVPHKLASFLFLNCSLGTYLRKYGTWRY